MECDFTTLAAGGSRMISSEWRKRWAEPAGVENKDAALLSGVFIINGVTWRIALFSHCPVL